MVDREKVIKGLKCCEEGEITACQNCPYTNDNPDCIELMIRDAIELLEEQDKKIEELEERIAIMME